MKPSEALTYAVGGVGLLVLIGLGMAAGALGILLWGLYRAVGG